MEGSTPRHRLDGPEGAPVLVLSPPANRAFAVAQRAFDESRFEDTADG
jgi:hypothetical protein